MAQTKQNGFHFVDEAAPPNLLREVALEILRRKLVVVWWTNIRFEKHFTADLSRLLKAQHRHAGQATESTQHHQIALGEAHGLSGLVDQHEPERNQAVDASDRDAADDQLKKLHSAS